MTNMAANGGPNGGPHGGPNGGPHGGPAALTTGATMAAPLDLEYSAVASFTVATPGGEGGFPARWWSPVLRAELVLAEFAGTAWRDARLPDIWSRPPSPISHGCEKPKGEIKKLMDLRARRAERRAEILAQSDDFSGVFVGLLEAGGGRRPATETLVHAAIAIGSMVALHWKWVYQRARPSQVYPALLPMIQTPPHPSFPSGHGLQSMLVALLLADTLGEGPGEPGGVLKPVLEALARRIGENREVAGVHYTSDTAAGQKLAELIMPILKGLAADQDTHLARLRAAAREEWSGTVPGDAPEMVNPWLNDAAEIAAELAALHKEKMQAATASFLE